MIKLENKRVFNFEGAFRGLRNPMDSWHLSDSVFGILEYDEAIEMTSMVAHRYEESEKIPIPYDEAYEFLWDNGVSNAVFNCSSDMNYSTAAILGPNDLNLAQRMIGGGTPESKFLRQIFVSMDITAPLYFWKEYDTYKVATVSNSCSTMHKIDAYEITEEDYSFDPEPDLKLTDLPLDDYIRTLDIKKRAVNDVEWLRKKYKETGDKRYWRLLIQVNPDGWLQKRTWTGNYQNLREMCFWRPNHKLIEWREFCKEILKLPYGKELISYRKENKK